MRLQPRAGRGSTRRLLLRLATEMGLSFPRSDDKAGVFELSRSTSLAPGVQLRFGAWFRACSSLKLDVNHVWSISGQRAQVISLAMPALFGRLCLTHRIARSLSTRRLGRLDSILLCPPDFRSRANQALGWDACPL
jgi:hypothetical protein